MPPLPPGEPPPPPHTPPPPPGDPALEPVETPPEGSSLEAPASSSRFTTGQSYGTCSPLSSPDAPAGRAVPRHYCLPCLPSHPPMHLRAAGRPTWTARRCAGGASWSPRRCGTCPRGCGGAAEAGGGRRKGGHAWTQRVSGHWIGRGVRQGGTHECGQAQRAPRCVVVDQRAVLEASEARVVLRRHDDAAATTGAAAAATGGRASGCRHCRRVRVDARNVRDKGRLARPLRDALPIHACGGGA